MWFGTLRPKVHLGFRWGKLFADYHPRDQGEVEENGTHEEIGCEVVSRIELASFVF
jgi:hypothetical protein